MPDKRGEAQLKSDEPRGSDAPAAAVTLPAPGNVAYESLRLVAIFRTAAPIAQASTIAFSVYSFGGALPLAPLIVLIGLEALIAAFTWKRLSSGRAVSVADLVLHIYVDIAALTAMLYLTGGAESPFAPMLLVPLAVAASSLEPRWVWLTAAATVSAYIAAAYTEPALVQGLVGADWRLELPEVVCVIGYVVTGALLAYFVAKIRLELQRHSRMLAEVHNQQMRNESMVAMGALAAGCAHELSSPLGTVAVVVSELQRERTGDEKLQQNLQVVKDQIEVAKRVISNLTGAAGQRRAEAAGVARLDHFMHQIIERARALHPGTTIHAQIGDGKTGPRIVAEETLRQAFANLIDNAVRASPDYVEFCADWATDDLVVTVTDWGPGFPDDVLGKLGKAATAPIALDSGLGLGLLLTNVTLGRLDGSLSLYNKPHSGARAEVRLPLRAILFGENDIGNERAVAG